MVAFEDFRQAAADGDILVFQIHSGAVVEVRAPRNPHLQKQFWQSIGVFEGVNQLCLFPITQELQIDAQAFF
ncbi:hypothetical protein AGR5A_pb0023 [Agrobacterium genomosp. 5 str. CFBP 6626]|nr:hypothetical protein AGR5A_pb0023 [Agrobacterium genomosp. 5 str. CFBP 6626]